jgi:hypothetical protein
MKIKSVLIVFCVLMGSVLSSKTTHAFKISGVVLDETKMPVPGARIMMEPQKIQMITEVDGKFVITGLSANTYNSKYLRRAILCWCKTSSLNRILP